MVKNKKKKFYKKEKQKVEIKKSPRNYRIITEKLFSDHLIFFIGIACLILALVVVGFDFYSSYQTQKQLAEEKIRVVSDLSFWENQVKEKPNYRDGYFSLALLYYQLKDFENSSKNLEKTMNLDPNFIKGKELQKLLEK